MVFEDFKFDQKIVDGLSSMGYTKPTPVQEQAIPHILEGKDLIACAQTGTGKTAAYLLPILHKIITGNKSNLNTLILAPTRELALQIDQQVEGFGYFVPVCSLPVYGGGDGATWDQQKKALKEGADIIIATPGRLIAHLTSGYVDFKNIQHLILDEADRMLEMGFFEDIMRIITYLPENRQNILFSATMPPKIRTLANKILKDPSSVNIAVSQPAVGINQQVSFVYSAQKVELVKRLLEGKENEIPSILIFCSTKISVKLLEKELHKLKFSVKGFHSDLEQEERETILSKFRSRKLQMLVATDILSRGIDIEGISMVINYDVPNDPEDYIHRIGRTARAETTGTAITFVCETDQHKFVRIEQLLTKEIARLPLPEDMGAGPAYNPNAKREHVKKDFKKKSFNRNKPR